MDSKTLQTLEFPKVLERLASYCAFLPSTEMAGALLPTSDLDLARRWQAETSEALRLITTHPDLSVGGARDVRTSVDLANHGGLLTPQELLDVKSTLLSARSLERLFKRIGEVYPHLAGIADRFPTIPGLVESITYAISERGEIQDSASEQLITIRRELRIAHERLLTKMQRMVSDPHNAPYLQEALITQRDGRYVLPLRAEFKGRIKSIVHDQSSSGATLFVEPLAVVDLNNQYRELQLAERDEERRVLTSLSQSVGRLSVEILLTLETIAELDLAFARARYSAELAASEPRLHPIPDSPGTPHPGSLLRLYGARHPLLNPQAVVPIDLELDPQTYALVITGPNTGGKTVTLKTVGLLALMAQAGLHIPARSGSEISAFHSIYADIGDEQSIEQSLSTFSGHINNIVRVLSLADRRSLVILDELGAGTDPQEGAALARALLSHLLERGITTLVTTHHPELKTFAHATPGAVNASMEFDLDTLKPTYRLTIGLPGRSNAIAIAQRLGMPEEIIQASRAELNPADLHVEDLLDEIRRQRDLAHHAREELELSLQEAEQHRTELASRLEKIEDERHSILENARQQAEAELEGMQEELRQARRRLARARQPLEAVEAVQEQVQELVETVEQPVERRLQEIPGRPLRRSLRLGDKVRLRSLKAQGVVTALGDEEVEVQVGILRVRARPSDLELASSEPVPPRTRSARGRVAADEPLSPTSEKSSPRKDAVQPAGPPSMLELPPSPGVEIDLRGKRADDALDTLERYLDSATLAGLPWVRIIHGKGTGKLRQSVRAALSQNPSVSSFESGGEKEGGDGVTIAKLHQG